MQIKWTIILALILIVVIIFGSMRQNRIKQLLLGQLEMVGGRGPSGHGSSGHGSSGCGRSGHG